MSMRELALLRGMGIDLVIDTARVLFVRWLYRTGRLSS